MHQRDDHPTQFERALQELAVKPIFADSPEARGRAERINGVFQDRLVAELRFRRITTAEGATDYLNRHFIPRYAKRFGVAPEEGLPAWRPLAPGMDLRHILCRRYSRVVNKDNTVSVGGRIIQIHPTRRRLSFVKAKVTVNHWLDGSWHVLHDQYGELPCEELVTTSSAGAATHARG